MPDPEPIITAASLRGRPEWAEEFPGAEQVWEELVDEGVGHAFDGLDLSAMVRATYRTSAPYAEVARWYRGRLEPGGWVARKVERSTGHLDWWRWDRPRPPGTERFDVIDQGLIVEYPGWPAPKKHIGMTVFEVSFTATSQPGVTPGESADWYSDA